MIALPQASCISLTFSVALLPCASGLQALHWQNRKIIPYNQICASRVAQSASREAQPYLPHVTPRSLGVSMPSFMPIGPKLWEHEGYQHTQGQTVLLLLHLDRLHNPLLVGL